MTLAAAGPVPQPRSRRFRALRRFVRHPGAFAGGSCCC